MLLLLGSFLQVNQNKTRKFYPFLTFLSEEGNVLLGMEDPI